MVKKLFLATLERSHRKLTPTLPQSSILRQIVAGPRQQHPEAGLDLCYVTENSTTIRLTLPTCLAPSGPRFLTFKLTCPACAVIATSGPSATYPQRAYRNPLDALVNFLDSKHGTNWCIWEFRAEGTGYPDSEVYGRIHHFPWPDHHPPPFALIPNIMGSMRNWLHRLDEKDKSDTDEGDDKTKKRVAVVHCKAGKGRSGTVATGYLISQEGWKKEDALRRFTERRMRANFGNGVSIPSQLRYVEYIDRWTNELGKQYIERPVEVLEIHTWGLRDGVKVAVEGYVDEGKKIKCFHLFHRNERTVVEAAETPATSSTSSSKDRGNGDDTGKEGKSKTWSPSVSQSDTSSTASELTRRSTTSPNMSAVIFRPAKPLVVAGSDINIDFERRSKASYTGFAMVTSVAHVWFNAFFEGGHEHDSGVFETEWDAMDGIKGSAKKGIRAFERLKVVWRYPSLEQGAGIDTAATTGRPISEPKPGEPIQESHPADWRGKKSTNKQENLPRRTTTDLEKESSPITTDSRTSDKTSEPGGASTGGIGSTLLAVGAGSLHELERQLGLRKQTDESKDVSLAGSDNDVPSTTDEEGRARRAKTGQQKPEGNGDLEGVQSYFMKTGGGEDESKTQAAV
ncbi:Phosphatase tensin type [Penicillium macrosclerotiorum]|uniref:Phosphatase tensin type n=1 Tax=Penicillium macrosclerotiorum TaxID=303699 RepID=UPI00254935D0|nr:Phosphatase tensin type [Penicillium macrosclerotiorum]KAJ5666737.1 Phosphatase tensin type [Penicillium macrosclerotiorum]